MAAVLPTKGNLMAAKQSRELARTGYDLMDRKRNILIREMMALIDDAKALQRQIDGVFLEAYQALQISNVRNGLCDHIAESVDVDNSLEIQYRSVMGVELPHITGSTPPLRPEYGFSAASSALDECFIKFREVKELIRKMAEMETTVYRLAETIRKTQKRANALQNIVIPGYDETIRLIADALEEKDREEFSRLKVIKRITAKTPEDADQAPQ